MQKTKYRDLLDTLEKSNYRNRSLDLCAFAAIKGNLYNRNLMVVGRAVNDWAGSFQLNNIEINDIVEELFSVTSEDECPLNWVEAGWGNSEGYNTKSSAFWRVIRELSMKINQLEQHQNWHSNIVWSNLYKIAPIGGGNPSDSLCDYQFNACNDLLKAEIEEFEPKCIIFLTGLNWFGNFLKENISIKPNIYSKWVDAAGTIKINGKVSKFVVAKHPQGKPESELLTEIFDALSNV